MARGKNFTAQVEKIAAGGAGIARPEGKSVFIELTAPGDRIRGRILKEHRNWALGELLEILEPSPLRSAPPCPVYGRCGGCSLQHLGYETQVEAKTGILRDAFIRIGGFDPPEIRVRRSAPFEYRNRIQFHKKEELVCPGKDICVMGQNRIKNLHCDKNRFKTRLGFMERKSSRLVFINDCQVADAGIRKALKEGKLSSPPGRKRFTVYSRLNTFLTEGLAEQGRVSILDRELAMDAGVFFQSNAAMLELLITDLVETASAADKSLAFADIYCGVGTFASFLGADFSSVDLVEENKNALALARENVQGKVNWKVNCHALSDTAWVKMQKEKRPYGQNPAKQKDPWGFMVLDPPREGLSGPLREWLALGGPRLAAYVSCDAATLARDSKVLVNGGYTLKELSMYDFYPQTAHIESLAVFSRESSAFPAFPAFIEEKQ